MRDFLGTYEHTLDEKGRLALPAEHRKLFATDTLFLARDPNFPSALVLLDPEAYDNDKKEMLREDPRSREAQARRLKFFSSTHEVSPNSAGRIQIPKGLRDHLGVAEGGVVVVLGNGDRVQLFSRPVFEQLFGGEGERGA